MSPGARLAAGLAGPAAMIGAVTAVSRVVGFGRLYVFSKTVGDSCLGSAYQTANLVPNVVFEVVAGGALASALVPVLAPSLRRGDVRRASITASAALTWSVLGLLAVAALLAAISVPLGAALVGGRTAAACPGVAATAATMLLVFAPQVPLYGIAVVLAGALQAQRRFLAAAAAPLLSSLVVTAAYLSFAGLAPARAVDHLPQLPGIALAVLAGGTTLGVLALAAGHAPALRSQLTWRPTLHFPPGDGRAVLALAGAGITALLAQQVATLGIAVLANHAGGPGAVNLWSYAWAMFLLPYAVLAVPVATSAFPGLAEAAADGPAALAAPVARSARAALLAAAAGAAVLAGTALPVAWVFVLGPVGSHQPGDMAGALVAFAPGLLGYALLAVLSRALYAAGQGRAVATGTAVGWLLALAAGLLLVGLAGSDRVVTALAAGNTVGMTVAGGWLLLAARRRIGPAATRGLARTAVVGAAAASAGAAAGWLIVIAVDAHGVKANLGEGVLAGALALGVTLALAAVLDRGDLTTALARIRRRGRP